MQVAKEILASLLLTALVFGVLNYRHSQAQKWEGKKYGYFGDPSKKRGIELGFDRGMKAAKQDEEQAEKLDPKKHDVMKLAEDNYSYEYGNRRTFIHGFQRGFYQGYKDALGKTPLPPSTIAQTQSESGEAPLEKEEPNRDPIRSDAL